MNGDEDEEEELVFVDTSASTRRAYYAGRDEGERRANASVESGAFRGVPTPAHGGQQTVFPEHTKGSYDYCWCGLPLNHDWPGKALGVTHPDKESAMSTPVGTTPEAPRIERKQLRGYHADVADVVITAVNQYGVQYRQTGSKILLYPPDGTSPLSVRAGTNEGERKRVMGWFAKHCVPPGTKIVKSEASIKEVDDKVIKELAETVNSEEHLPAARPAMSAKKAAAPAHPVKAEPEPVAEPEWVPYFVGRGKGHEDAEGTQHPHMETNGLHDESGQLIVRCTLDDWVGNNKGVGGHTRTQHRDTEDLHGQEARDKSRKTYFTTKMRGELEQALGMFQHALGVDVTDAKAVEKVKAELEKAQQQVAALREENGKQGVLITEQGNRLDEQGTQITELKAKLALLREAFSNLEE